MQSEPLIVGCIKVIYKQSALPFSWPGAEIVSNPPSSIRRKARWDAGFAEGAGRPPKSCRARQPRLTPPLWSRKDRCCVIAGDGTMR